MLHFRNVVSILNILKKRMTLIDFVVSKLRTPKTYSDKCLKRPVSENPSKSNMVNVPKHCSNLHHITLTILIDTAKSIQCEKVSIIDTPNLGSALLTHWLPMKSILFLIGTILRCQFRHNYLENEKLILNYWPHFWNQDYILNIF